LSLFYIYINVWQGNHIYYKASKKHWSKTSYDDGPCAHGEAQLTTDHFVGPKR
jgi:hypothetical protein